jgi:hypothetical protein
MPVQGDDGAGGAWCALSYRVIASAHCAVSS